MMDEEISLETLARQFPPHHRVWREYSALVAEEGRAESYADEGPEDAPDERDETSCPGTWRKAEVLHRSGRKLRLQISAGEISKYRSGHSRINAWDPERQAYLDLAEDAIDAFYLDPPDVVYIAPRP